MRLNKEFYFSNLAIAELLQAVRVQKADFRFQAKGASMSPFIKDGDIITISPASGCYLDCGKIVAFAHPKTEKLIIHRIIASRNNHYFTKGDSAYNIDGLIPKEKILGCVTRIERNNKDIRLGLGPERLIISLLSRGRLLSLFFMGWQKIPFALRRYIKCRLLL